MNIWDELPKPFLVLAPMDDVTDTVFRRVVAECARPDVMFTEFANADGLQSSGREAVMKKLRFYPEEQPLIAQLWGMNPDNYKKTTRELIEMGYVGVDINMGCPVPKVFKMGACSALINDRELAHQIITSTQTAAEGHLLVSVKTRIGVSNYDEDWLKFLLEHQLQALTIHGRTVKQMSKVPNDWEIIGKIRELRDKIAPNTKLIGNGDAMNHRQAKQLAQKYDLDGVMIGRGVFHDPYVFAQDSPWSDMDQSARLALFRRHIELFTAEWGPNKNPAVLKKFAKVYINGFEGASDLRSKLMATQTADELLSTLANS